MTPEAINRAIWVGTAVSIAIAVVLTVAASFLHASLVRITGMRSVATTISILISLFIFAFAGIVMTVVISSIVNRPASNGEMSLLLHVFVHPSLLLKLAPLVAIAITWVIVAIRWRSARREWRLSNST